MKGNDQSSLRKITHILQWISHVIKTPISSLSPSDIFQQKHLVTILLMVDHSYFECLQQLPSPNFLDLLILIEDYIQHVLGQQFKRRVLSEILKEKSFLQLLSLIMYIAVHSENKVKFIPSILQLTIQAQNSIKDIIQDISSCIQSQQSPANMTDMLNKIDQLQHQNQTLKHEMNEYIDKIDEFQQRYRILEHDYYFVENQNLSLKKERSYVCKELELNRYDDFVEKYRILEQDLDEAYQELKVDQNKIKELESMKKDCKARIMGDGEIIEELHQELKTARGMCKSLRMSSGFESPMFSPQPILTSRTLKQNIPCFNFNRIDDGVSAQRKKLYNFLSNQEQLEQQVERLRSQNYDIKYKNECLTDQIIALQQMNQSYRQAEQRLHYTNKQRKTKLQQLHILYKQFRNNVLSN